MDAGWEGRVVQAEAYLRGQGFREVVVRHHDRVARVEVPVDQMPRLLEDDVREGIVLALREAGFAYVTLDLQGFGSGNLDENVDVAPPPPSKA